MTKPVTVLFAIDHLHTGGAQEFLLQLCRSLPRDRVRVSVCALRGGGIYVERLERMGIPVTTLAPSGQAGWRLFAIFRLWQMLRTREYDILHTLLEGTFTVGTPLAWLLGLKNIHSIMAIRSQVAAWYFLLMRLYQPFVSAYCTPVPKELLDNGIQSEKIGVVEVAIDIAPMLQVKHSSEAPPNIDLSPDDLVCVSIARLSPDKGHEFAIMAWQRVVERLPNARLVVVGDGQEEGKLRDQIAALGLGGKVILSGFRSDLPCILSRADIFIRASLNEGVNLVTIQGMAAGLPVVGFANPVPKEIIVHEHNGLLVPPHNVSELADAVVRLGDNVELRRRFGDAARVGVGDYYSVNPIVKYYLGLYEVLAAGFSLANVAEMNSRWPFTQREVNLARAGTLEEEPQ